MEHTMFCFQCEQTAGCTGCTGKAADQFLSFADKVLPCRVDQVQPVDIENY